jgi:hypothetical protein
MRRLPPLSLSLWQSAALPTGLGIELFTALSLGRSTAFSFGHSSPSESAPPLFGNDAIGELCAAAPSEQGNEHPMNTETMSTTSKPSAKGTFIAAISAVGSVLATLACCLPVLPFVLAAGTAGSSAFLSHYTSALRPYLLGVSVLLIALGFYQSRRATQCNCKPSVLSQVVLWLSALIVAISIFLPQAFADLVERVL